MKTLALALLFLLLVCPVFAQDATREPTADITLAPISIVTAEAPNTGDVNVTVNTPAAETPAPADGSLWGYVLVIGVVIVSGFVGVSMVLQAIGNRAAAAASNPLEIAVIEKAYASIPESVVNTLIKPLQESLERSDAALKQVITLLGKATDGIPESEKIVTDLPKTSTLTQSLPLPDHKD